jgi:hypothetical protein
LTEVGLPGFEPILDSRDALAADCFIEGAIVIRGDGWHEVRDIARTVESSVRVKFLEFSQETPHCRLAGFRESRAKDNRVARFPQDEKPLPKETKDVGHPLGAGIGNVAKGIQEHMWMLKVGPKDWHTTTKEVIPPDLVLLVNERVQRRREIDGIE